MTYPLSVTDPGIRAILTAFEHAKAVVTTVENEVNAAQSGMKWSGDASTTYRTSLGNWRDGLHQVRAGLNQMDTAMNEHQQATNNAENRNTDSSGWYR